MCSRLAEQTSCIPVLRRLCKQSSRKAGRLSATSHHNFTLYIPFHPPTRPGQLSSHRLVFAWATAGRITVLLWASRTVWNGSTEAFYRARPLPLLSGHCFPFLSPEQTQPKPPVLFPPRASVPNRKQGKPQPITARHHEISDLKLPVCFVLNSFLRTHSLRRDEHNYFCYQNIDMV